MELWGPVIDWRAYDVCEGSGVGAGCQGLDVCSRASDTFEVLAASIRPLEAENAVAVAYRLAASHSLGQAAMAGLLGLEDGYHSTSGAVTGARLR